MEKQYGKRTLANAINDMHTSSYLKTHAQPCPRCGVQISKTDGCNRVR